MVGKSNVGGVCVVGEKRERESREFARRPERPHRVLSNDPGGSSR